MGEGLSGAKLQDFLEKQQAKVEGLEIKKEREPGDVNGAIISMILTDGESFGDDILEQIADQINALAKKDGINPQQFLESVLIAASQMQEGETPAKVAAQDDDPFAGAAAPNVDGDLLSQLKSLKDES